MKYKVFNEYIIRKPIIPIENFKNFLFKEFLLDSDIINFLKNNNTFLEAIYLASPDFHEEVIKWMSNKSSNSKIKHSLIKYITRASTRSTPFGLFSGTNISNNNMNNIIRKTRLDNEVLIKLEKIILQEDFLKKGLKYKLNDSLYSINEDYRFVEFEYNGNYRNYSLSNINKNIYLDKVISILKGVFFDFKMLKDTLKSIDDELEENEIHDFFNNLIDFQLIKSELNSISISNDPLNKFIDTLKNIDSNNEIYINLVKINNILYRIDLMKEDNILLYKECESIIKDLRLEYNKKHLFQVDSLVTINENDYLKVDTPLLKKIEETLNKVIYFDLDITDPPLLERFKKNFSKRYEDINDISLTTCLDPEIGIQYNDNKSSYSPLLRNINFNKPPINKLDIVVSPIM